MTIEQQTYEDIADALDALGLDIDAAEVHGMICGLLSTNPALDWLTLLGNGSSQADPKLAPALDVLNALRDGTVAVLNDTDFNLQLLLPDDAQSLKIRTKSLSLWCYGYLSGIGFSGHSQVIAEIQEVNQELGQFVELSNLDFEQVVESEEDETAYTELYEYVRMAVMMMYVVLADVRAIVMKPSETVH